MTPFARAALRAAALLAIACGGSASGPSATSETLVLRLETPRFRVYAGQAADDVVRGVLERLEAQRPRMAADLEVVGAMPIDVRVWQDRASWDAALVAYFGQALGATGYVTGRAELRVLAVNEVARTASHELAHALSLDVNPAFGNNPRWLWEAVALYENGEFVDPRSLSYMTGGRPPTLQELNASVNASQQVYQVGYTLCEYVVVRHGREALLRLIRAGGDTAATLGLTESAFTDAWYAFVRERYLS